MEYLSRFNKKKGDTCSKLCRNGGCPEGLVYTLAHFDDDAEAKLCARSLRAIESLRGKPLEAGCILEVVVE